MASTENIQVCPLPSSGTHFPTFGSISGFLAEFLSVTGILIGEFYRVIFKGHRRIDPFFRETVCLAVTFANNCRQ